VINKYLGEDSVFGLSLFAREVTDQILWEFNAATFITQARNVGKAAVTGGDIQYNAAVLKGLDVFANATFQTAVDREDVTAANVGKDIPYSPRTKASLGIDWENRFGKVTLLARQVGERYSDAANTNKLDAYTVTDLNYSRKLGKARLFARINNLFNASYSEAVGWHPVTYAILGYPMPGRTYTFGMGCDL
jgi:outer membrane receptor protein involved in Fe transport